FITHNQIVDDLCKELGICTISDVKPKTWNSIFISKKNSLRLKYLQFKILIQKTKKQTNVKFNQISRHLHRFFINLKFTKIRSTHQYSKDSKRESRIQRN